MTIYDIEKETLSTQTLTSALDIRYMISYQFNSCGAKSSSKPDSSKILEIVLPVTIGGIVLVAIVAGLVHRHRKRRHYHSINSHHHH
jgi:hypothetical protein